MLDTGHNERLIARVGVCRIDEIDACVEGGVQHLNRTIVVSQRLR